MWKSVNVLKLESKMIYETVFSILIGRTLKKTSRTVISQNSEMKILAKR